MNCDTSRIDRIEKITPDTRNYAEIAELESLREENKCLFEENQKLGIKYDEARKYIEDLERKIPYLEGQVEAFRYCMRGDTE